MSINTMEDAIEEILLWLPVQSLVRYKVVCKKWLDLIESSAFIKAHLKLSSKREREDRVRILVNYFDDVEGKNIVTCFDNYESMAMASSGQGQGAFDFDLTEFSNDDNKFPIDFVSTNSNGIVCLAVTDYSDISPIVLFNPALRQFRTIPPCPFDPIHYCTDSDLMTSVFAFGFGFDDATNDFKVVRMMYRTDYGGGTDISSWYYMEAQVYDSRNCWRRSGRIHIIIATAIRTPLCLPVLFNGILHCVCWNTTEQQLMSTESFITTHTCSILTFNISTEIFEMLEFPQDYCHVRGKMEPGIFMADESTLALVDFTNPFQTYPVSPRITCIQLDVWLMKEYGVRESWIKQYSIMSPDSRVGKPLSFVKKDKLLFITTDGKLICYDLHTGQQRQLRRYQFRPYETTLGYNGASYPIQCFEKVLYPFGVVILNESLVSIKKDRRMTLV